MICVVRVCFRHDARSVVYIHILLQAGSGQPKYLEIIFTEIKDLEWIRDSYLKIIKKILTKIDIKDASKTLNNVHKFVGANLQFHPKENRRI